MFQSLGNTRRFNLVG